VERSKRRASRLTSLGLGLVLLALAAFAVAAALITSGAVTRAGDLTAASSAYERGRYGISQEESLERKYRLEPGPGIRALHGAAAAEVKDAMRSLEGDHNAGDGAIAQRVLQQHVRYLASIDRMFDAVDRGDDATVLRIDADEVDPVFGAIEREVHDAAVPRHTDAVRALHNSAAITRRLAVVAPIVFAAGLGLLALLWRLRRREQLAADRDLLLQNKRLKQTLVERQEAEQELAHTRERLVHAQRLDSLGQLAGGVAHDFNNLLQVILGYCGLMGAKVTPDGHEPLGQIQLAAERGADLTRQLLAFGSRQVLTTTVSDIGAIVADVEKMLARVLPGQIEFRVVPPQGELRARVDRSQVEQVLVNLVMNARDAMPDGGSVTITTDAFELESPAGDEHSDEPASYVKITVSDTGCGMDDETKSRVFEPFFTTKDRGQGTGLGLATVYGIVRQSGGFVALESSPGRGAEFAVCLPRVEEPVASKVLGVGGRADDDRVSQRVLLVDDEPDVRSVLASYLRERGHIVTEAADGEEGLAAFRADDEIDVVVTDIVMPRLDGWRLADRIRELRGEMPIIAMSGYTGEAERASDEQLEYLAKPFLPWELADAIERVVALEPAPAQAA
jgi:signal transduction histidine kinase/ActR/RegA family two-component response regulator